MQDENAPRDAALPLRLAVVLLIACTQVGATQLTSRVQRGLMAPFAITWCHACLQVLCWPAGNVRRTPTTDALNRSDLAIFPLLFLGANYAYVRALALRVASPSCSASSAPRLPLSACCRGCGCASRSREDEGSPSAPRYVASRSSRLLLARAAII